ncbi:hypothetical protein [Mycobacterium aquaticum]|uniref:hypothetical protein n=1 Tax=Mycobacterium aquaticum TaxID=1927124 RepID=UPI001153215A|nr:hypothetical protein [Mycobacterium aquaticum]
MRIARWLPALLILVVSSCGSPHTTRTNVDQFVNWPNQFDNFRFHWYAAAGVDLTAGPAVAIRAYVESYNLAIISGDSETTLYPGFLEATPVNLPQKAGTPIELTSVRPDPHPLPASADNAKEGSKQEYFGYQPSYLLSLEKADDTYHAIVCEGDYATYKRDETRPGKYRSLIASPETGALQFGDWQSVSVRRIELTERPPHDTDVLVSQQGPVPAPQSNVFGRWFISAASGSLWGPSGHGVRVATPELQQQCLDHMPDDATARQAIATGFHDQPPPHGQPIPGWPAKSR